MKNALLLIGLVALGCASNTDDIETRTSEVSSISFQTTLPPAPSGLPGPFTQAPAFAYNGSHWVAVVQAHDDTICTTYDNPAGSNTWHSWYCLLTPPPAGIYFGATPAITNLPNGLLLILVTGVTDQQVYGITVSYAGLKDPDETWHLIQPGALFFENPTVALNPLPQIGNSNPTLLMVARGLDNNIYSSRNIVTSSGYLPSNWEAFALMTNPNGHQYKGTPAVSMVCTAGRTSASFIAAMRNSDDTYRYSFYDGQGFGAGFTIPNGLFKSSPTLACAGSGTSSEQTIWGVGYPPYNLYYAVINGLPAGFTLASSMAFGDNAGIVEPKARGTTNNKAKIGLTTPVHGNPSYANVNSP